MSNKNKLIWSAVFIAIFLLSQDYLFVSWEGKPSVLGFPNWIAWFGVVHLIFIAAMYIFAKKYWN